jgi:hypothetical protein
MGGIRKIGFENSIARIKLGETTPQKWQAVPVSGETAALWARNPGFEYDPERNAFVLWAFEDPAALTVLPLDTFVAYRVPQTVTPFIAHTIKGVWGRFRRYGPNQYGLLTSAAHPLYMLSL